MEGIRKVQEEGYIPMSLYMSDIQAGDLHKWANRNCKLFDDERYKYITPRYLDVPIITDENVPYGQVWITRSRLPLEADIIEL